MNQNHSHLQSQADSDASWARRMQPALGAYVEAAAWAGTPEVASAAVESALAEVRSAHRRWSFHDPASELSQLNRAPGRFVRVSSPTLRLLRLARGLMCVSGGAFDVTLGGLLVKSGRLPDHGGTPGLPRGRPEDIELGPGRVRLLRPVRITLDGIAKGFAVDLAVKAMQRAGARSGWVNAGGDLRAFGDLTLPVHVRGNARPLALVGGLHNLAMATTGAPPDGWGQDPTFPGQVYGIDSQPAQGGVITVLAPTAWRADALTKVAACTAASNRQGVIRRLGGSLLGSAP